LHSELLAACFGRDLYGYAAGLGRRKDEGPIFDDGRQEFEENFVACHGWDGTAGTVPGELAAKLLKQPKDLTAIAKGNGGECV
jgi:hypothetical protein